MGWKGDGARDVKGNALNPHTEGDIGGRLGEASVNHDGVRFGIGERDVKGQPFHQRDFQVFEFIPQGIVDVQRIDRPLEGRTNPQFGRHTGGTRNRIVTRFNSKAFTEGGQTLKG